MRDLPLLHDIIPVLWCISCMPWPAPNLNGSLSFQLPHALLCGLTCRAAQEVYAPQSILVSDCGQARLITATLTVPYLHERRVRYIIDHIIVYGRNV